MAESLSVRFQPGPYGSCSAEESNMEIYSKEPNAEILVVYKKVIKAYRKKIIEQMYEEGLID